MNIADWQATLGQRVSKRRVSGNAHGTIFKTFPNQTHVIVLFDDGELSPELTRYLTPCPSMTPMRFDTLEEANDALQLAHTEGRAPFQGYTHVVVGVGEHARTFIKPVYGAKCLYELKPWVKDTTTHIFG